MTITLTPEQQAWIEAHVARGEFASMEDAARRLIDIAIIDHATLEADDLAWAKPLVDEALAEAERGNVISREDFQKSVQSFLASSQDR